MVGHCQLVGDVRIGIVFCLLHGNLRQSLCLHVRQWTWQSNPLRLSRSGCYLLRVALPVHLPEATVASRIFDGSHAAIQGKHNR